VAVLVVEAPLLAGGLIECRTVSSGLNHIVSMPSCVLELQSTVVDFHQRTLSGEYIDSDLSQVLDHDADHEDIFLQHNLWV
jgi:hypothetical protein